MITVPETEPEQAFAGDTWQWKRLDLASEYPATDWDLKYYFDSRTPIAQFAITAVPIDTDKFSVVLVPATTSAFIVSDSQRAQSGYHWVARVEHQADGRVFTIDEGNLSVSLDLATQTTGGFDPRSWAKKSLDALQSRIEGRASIDQLGHTIAGDQIQYMTPEQIQAWYGWFRAEVQSMTNNGVKKSLRVELSRGY